MSVLIRQAKVVDPQSAFHNKIVDILIENGTVKSIGSSLEAHSELVIAGNGLQVSPGWVDIFADYREPGFEQKETISSGLNAAAAGGFTDVFLAPNTNPTVSTKSLVQFILQKALGNVVKVHPLGSVTKDIEGKTLAEMLDMHAHGAIAFTDGWKPVQQGNLMLKALEYVKAFEGTLIQIPLDASLSEGGLMHEGPVSTKLGMAGIPVLAETIHLYRDIELLRYTGSRLHVSGISTQASVDMIRKAKEEGLQISCSVTPYHLALNDEALQSYSSLYKVMPVLRSEDDRQALIAGLKDGTIDCISSHHRPQEWDAKEREFEYAGEGMNIQEISFQVVYEAVSKEVPLERLIDAFAIQPRKIFGLPERIISEGNPAVMTVFVPEESFVFDDQNLQSSSRNNPFIGREFKGKITGIINQHKFQLNNQ